MAGIVKKGQAMQSSIAFGGPEEEPKKAPAPSAPPAPAASAAAAEEAPTPAEPAPSDGGPNLKVGVIAGATLFMLDDNQVRALILAISRRIIPAQRRSRRWPPPGGP